MIKYSKIMKSFLYIIIKNINRFIIYVYILVDNIILFLQKQFMLFYSII